MNDNIKYLPHYNLNVSENGVVTRYRGGKFKEYKVQVCPLGYCRIGVVLPEGKRKNFGIHRLVAEAFIPNPENKSEVNHIDGNKSNNHVSNLEWATRRENCNHAKANGLYKPGTGRPFGWRKNKNQYHGSVERFNDIANGRD